MRVKTPRNINRLRHPLRVDRDLAEAALSHTLGIVEGAYRRETAIEARWPVMEAHAQWLLGEGANVIAFPTRV